MSRSLSDDEMLLVCGLWSEVRDMSISVLSRKASRSMLKIGMFVPECGDGEVMYAWRLLSRNEGVMVCEGGSCGSKGGVEGRVGVGVVLSCSVLLFFSPWGVSVLVDEGGAGWRSFSSPSVVSRSSWCNAPGVSALSFLGGFRDLSVLTGSLFSVVVVSFVSRRVCKSCILLRCWRYGGGRVGGHVGGGIFVVSPVVVVFRY
jgi:hypothetical protein